MNGNGHDASLDYSETDVLLGLSVRDAISRYEPIRAASIDSMEVRSSGGKVVLSGLVGSEAHKYVAAQIAARVPGVRAVENRLVTREDVERRVSLTLASSPTTKHLRIHVRVSESTVTLYGVASTQQEASAALALAEEACAGLAVRSDIEILPAGSAAIILEQHSVEGRRLAAAQQDEVPEQATESSAGHSSPASTPPVEGMA